MKRFSNITLVLVAGLVFLGLAATAQAEVLEYEVTSIAARSWVVTAKEMVSGKLVKFRLPHAIFHGQTFDANLENIKAGDSFKVKGPRNAQVRNVIVEKPLRNGPTLRHTRAMKTQLPAPEGPLGWEIKNINPKRWIVTAKNRQTGKMIKFKVRSENFIGFRFKADLSNIRKGQGFTMVAPNNQPFENHCRLIK